MDDVSVPYLRTHLPPIDQTARIHRVKREQVDNDVHEHARTAEEPETTEMVVEEDRRSDASRRGSQQNLHDAHGRNAETPLPRTVRVMPSARGARAPLAPGLPLNEQGGSPSGTPPPPPPPQQSQEPSGLILSPSTLTRNVLSRLPSFLADRTHFKGWTRRDPAEDMDKSDMQRTVESLRHQLNIERMPISKSAAELRRFTECQQDQDPLVNPVDKRVNPWAEKSKCEIL